MLVSEPRTAAQLVTPEGERLYFDDVGCLVDHVSRHAPELAHAWVKDERGQWIDALRTHYHGGEATPMGYGFVADATGALDFEQLRREVAQKRVSRSAL
jgi:copper chaperone NosL